MQDDVYEEGEAEAENISWLVGHALTGHRELTEELWRALAADKSDCHDEGRWLRLVAQRVVGAVLDGDAIDSEERGRYAMTALGLGDTADLRWQLKEDIEALSMFDDLDGNVQSRTPTQIARAMKKRGHFEGTTVRNAAKVVTRILRRGTS